VCKNEYKRTKMSTVGGVVPSGMARWERQFVSVSQLGSVRDVWRVSLFGCVSDAFACCTRLTCLRSGTCVLICVFVLGRLFFRGGQAVPQQRVVQALKASFEERISLTYNM
jgi:hypothetical protein